MKFSEIHCIAQRVLQTSKGFWVFSSVNHFSEGRVNTNHNNVLSSLAENDSTLFKNSEGNCDGEQIFCQRKEADVALLLQVTRIRKIRKICEANLTSRLLPKTGRSQLKQRTLNTKQTKWITIHQSRITNHDLLNWNK